MASQTPVAIRYLGLVPTLKGFEKNLGRELSSTSITNQASNAGRSIGSRMASSIGSSLKTGLKIGGVVAGAVAGITLKGGFDRALGIEDARAKMGGLGHDTQTVEKIMGNALASVEGTAFGLDAAATTAAGAVAAGIKPGEQLEKTLSTVANTAAAAGTGMDEIGSIFNTVASVGSAYTGDINMIAQRGIPIWQSLGDQLGKSQAEVKKMATEGKIDFATFEAAAADAAGGVATAMGDTTRGSFANMMASVRKLGAMFAVGILPLAKTTFQGIQGLLNAVKAQMEPFVNAFFERFGGSAQAGIQSFFDGLIARVEAFDPEPVMAFFREVEGGIRAFGAAWAANDGDITSSGFPGFMEQAAYWIRQFWDSIKSLDFSALAGVFGGLADGMKTAGSAVSDASSGGGFSSIGASLQTIWQASPNLIAAALEVLASALSFVADNSDTIVKLLPLIVGGMIAYKVATQAGAAATNALAAADTISLPLQIARNITSQQAAVARYRAAMATRAEVTADAQKTLSTVRATIAERTRTIATTAGAVASRAAAVATRLLGAAIRFATGPIGLIITGITLLVGALVWFFTKTETGQKLWSQIWGWIKDAAAAVVTWFMNSALPLLQAAWQGIAAGALWLYHNAILPAWSGIQTAVKVVGDWITGTLWPALQTAWQGIASGATWLYRNVIQPVWTGIKIAIAVVVTAIGLYVDLIKWYFANVLAPVALWLYNNVIKPAWAGIQIAIGAVVAWMRDTAWPILQAAWQAVGAAARWLYNSVILPVWNAIKAAIAAVVDWFQRIGWPALQLTIKWIGDAFKWAYNNVIKPVWAGIRAAISAVVSWFKNTAWPIIQTVIGWLRMSFEGWKIIAQAVWSAVRAAVRVVVDWFRDTAWPIVRSVIEALKTGFNVMRDKIRDAWKFIKDRVINPVATWFRDTIQPMFKRVTDGVKDSFESMKDGIKKAWEAVRDTAKAPVKFVVEDIVRDGIVAKYNEVAKVFKVPTINPDNFKVGWSSGGYTGPGSKYTPAGVVHADEYVIRKESQNSLRRAAPGFLDRLNREGARALDGAGYGYASGGWVKPFRGSYRSNSPYGMRGGRLHAGMDFPTPTGTPMTAVSDGVVTRTTTSGPAGNRLALATDMPGIVAGYHHLSRFAASVGQKVSKGQVIGYSGNTGRSTGPHLHFSIKRNGSYVNPSPYLSGAGVAGSDDGGGFWNPFDGLWEGLKSKVREGVGDSQLGDMLFEVPQKLISGAVDWASSKLAELGDWASDKIDTAAGAARWTGVATEALVREGQFGPKRLAALLKRMNQESGFNPRAINNWDSNARAGIPSKGLMQVIQPTFDAHRDKSLSSDIYDPLANIVASIRYTLSRYGDLEKGWGRAGGYASGGYTGRGSKYEVAGVVHADEHVIRKESRASIERARPGFLDALNARGASALRGYASGGRVLPTSKIGSTKVQVIIDGLTGTEKQVVAASGKLADAIVKSMNDSFKAAKTTTVNRLSDSLAGLKKQTSTLNKTISATTAKSKKNTINRLTDDLKGLRAERTKLRTAKKDLTSINKRIASTEAALVKARRGDYSGAASAARAQLKRVEAQIASTDKALKAARRGDTSKAAAAAGAALYKSVSGSVDRLTTLAAKSDELNKKIKTANADFTAQMKLRDDYMSSMTEKLSGAYALSDTSATTGIETIIRGFQNAASTVRTFAAQLRALKERGLSDDLVDQVAQLGADAGSKVATNLLSGTDSQLAQMTKQYNALNAASASTGKALARQMYQDGVDTAKGYVNGLNAQLKAVDKASAALADTVVKTVKRKLGIKSPSRVFDEIAGHTVDGYVNRIESETSRVRKAMVVMQTPPRGAELDGPTGATPSGRRGVTITGGNFGFDPDSIAQGIHREERKQALLYTY